jgi:hypothetical protein
MINSLEMSYIIVWRNTYREPHIDVNSHGFKEAYSSYEEAKRAAVDILESEGPKSEWYFDYQIYEEVDS